MRIAWLGPTPTEEGGVPFVASQLLAALARAGVEIECYVASPEASLPERLLQTKGLRFHCRHPHWDWDRWYSRTPLMSFVTGQGARALAQGRLIGEMVEHHRKSPYAAVYQFSQPELFSLRKFQEVLPPIVLHPEVHAAGELRWHRREAKLARECEGRAWNLAVRGMLTARAHVQKRDMRRAAMVIAPSNCFAQHLVRDYELPISLIRVIPNPIDLERFSPAPGVGTPNGRPIRLLFVARMSVRKGVEMIVSLSHRLADLAGKVEIHAVGEWSQWSDYRPLLAELNSAVATYIGPMDADALPDCYRHAHGVLQPSHYEPFALTVGEALASGLPVVVSHEVGAAEGVDPRCCTVFAAGDEDGFEAAVRGLVDRLQAPDAGPTASIARAEAERLFSPDRIARRLVDTLEELVAHGPRERIGSARAALG